MIQQYNLDEIKQLEISLTNNPSDTDLMNKLAIGYLFCIEADSSSKVNELLKKAYEIKPSIKTANNYAYQIITDWDYKEGIEILKPFIDKKPNSFMPYNLIGYAYLMSENYEKAEVYFEIAIKLAPTKMIEIIHNLGVCKNYLSKPQEALNLYEKSIEITDNDNESKYNKAVCQIELNQTSGIDEIIKKIKTSEAYKQPAAWISNTDLSRLSYINNDIKLAYELLMENCNFDLLSYPEFCYLLLKFNDSKFNVLEEEEIERIKSWIADLNNPEDEEYEDYTEKERAIEIKRLQDEIETIKNLRYELLNPPEIKPSELYKKIFCGCMFYDCKIHGTRFDD